ncbi:hypothetical protein ACFLZ8_00015 [Planctomycetota bacterium]
MNDEKIEHNHECENEDHQRHLCYVISQGFHLSDPQSFEAMIENPQFLCRHCSRTANSNENLCVPEEMP